MDYLRHKMAEGYPSIQLSREIVATLARYLLPVESEGCWGLFNKCQSSAEVYEVLSTLTILLQTSVDENDKYKVFECTILEWTLIHYASSAIDRINHSGVASAPTKRTHISDVVRFDVLASGKCAFCDSAENLQVDHIIPLSKGGTNERSNLQALCEYCNKVKNSKYESQIIRQLLAQLKNYQLREPITIDTERQAENER